MASKRRLGEDLKISILCLLVLVGIRLECIQYKYNVYIYAYVCMNLFISYLLHN